ncbi:VOC family protein [Parasphingorhabdus sp.]|uniref:VOC family protein n=1 Tax=Parasphingorhabdus sp. TaxID=2709688 RepID=UPI003266179D
MILDLHHVQLAMPKGGEDKARGFYRDILGLPEREKPLDMQQNGGCWFEYCGVRVHLGVEQDFRPAQKAHPAFSVRGFGQLRRQCETAGFATRQSNNIDGQARFFVDDPFGNRVEIIDGENPI